MQMVGAVAEFERAMIRERTSAEIEGDRQGQDVRWAACRLMFPPSGGAAKCALSIRRGSALSGDMRQRAA